MNISQLFANKVSDVALWAFILFNSYNLGTKCNLLILADLGGYSLKYSINFSISSFLVIYHLKESELPLLI